MPPNNWKKKNSNNKPQSRDGDDDNDDNDEDEDNSPYLYVEDADADDDDDKDKVQSDNDDTNDIVTYDDGKEEGNSIVDINTMTSSSTISYSSGVDDNGNDKDDDDGVVTNNNVNSDDQNKNDKLKFCRDWLQRRIKTLGSILASSLETKNKEKTPYKYAAVLSSSSLMLLYHLYEQRRQKQLTRLPTILGQLPPDTIIRSVYDKLVAGVPSVVAKQHGNNNNNNNNSNSSNLKDGGTILSHNTTTTGTNATTSTAGGGILNRPIVPTMYIGTNAQLSSAAAYLNPGPPSRTSKSYRYTEIMTSSYDGADIVLDWEIPIPEQTTIKQVLHVHQNRRNVVLILHGINNSSELGYMKSLSRTFVDRGWYAVSMNFRGCGYHHNQNKNSNNNKNNKGKKKKKQHHGMTTPRSYTASYTGDLRSVVTQLCARLFKTTTTTTTTTTNGDNTNKNNTSREDEVCGLFLVGNSLGANLITKYLGEEGLADTLPHQVKGGVSLGNPFLFRSNHIGFPFNGIIGAARKYNYYQNKDSLLPMMRMEREEQKHAKLSSLLSFHPRYISLAALDRSVASSMIRNSNHPPYETKIGYGQSTNNTSTTTSSSTKKTDHESNCVYTDTMNNNTTQEDGSATEYWLDSSSYKQQRHISVPFMHILSKDDFLCYKSSQYFLHYALCNPNIIFVETECGGHLGWQSVLPPNNNSNSKNKKPWSLSSVLFGGSWADTATADFFQAIIDTNSELEKENNRPQNCVIARRRQGWKKTKNNYDGRNAVKHNNKPVIESSSSSSSSSSSMKCLSGDDRSKSSSIATHVASTDGRNITNRGDPSLWLSKPSAFTIIVKDLLSKEQQRHDDYAGMHTDDDNNSSNNNNTNSNSKNNNNNDRNIFRSSIHYGEEGYLTMRLKRNRKLEQQDAIKLTYRLQSRL